MYLIIGQSNAKGRGDPPYYECTQTEARMWRTEGTDAWVALADPLSGTNPGGSMGPRLADYLRANGATSVGFIGEGVGGSHSNSWVPNPSDPFDTGTNFGLAATRALAALQAAPAGSKLKGTIVYQGETNAQLNDAEDWQPDWTDALDTLATEFSSWLAPDYQELIVKLPAAGVAGYADWEAVRTAQAATATARGALIVQAPVATLDDGLHLDTGTDDTEGQRALGVLVGDALIP